MFSGFTLLYADRGPVTPLQQSVPMMIHPQSGQQIFKHGASPGDQHLFAAVESVFAAQVKPRFLGDVPFGNGDKRSHA